MACSRALAVAGVVISVATRRVAAQSALLAFMTVGLIFGPLEQAHLHTAAVRASGDHSWEVT